ncbi:ABC transporter permease [bacterium]|nr:ABC transporter permease [bacterium]
MKYLASKVKGNSLWSDALRRLLSDNLAVFSFLVIAAYIVTALLASSNLIAVNWQDSIGASQAAPSFVDGFSHWMGLDIFGRSVLQKTVQGAYTALYVGLVSSLISIPIGVLMGALAGYFGGWVDDLITWIYTTISNIPEILLLVSIAFALGKGIETMCIALGMTSWVGLARLIRAEFIKHKNREYVAAAQALGASHSRRIFKHIFPNVLHIVIIGFSLRFVVAIKSEVVLTYLGLGIEIGEGSSWGLMISDAAGELVQGIWWGLASATLAMFPIVLAFSLFTDALRDAFDPKLRT